MKAIITVVCALSLFAAGTFSNAEEPARGVKKEKAEEKAGAADWMASFYSKIVKAGKKRPTSVPTSVAGLRGEEQEKEAELAPYWKGKEKSKDGAAMAEIENLINRKDYASAIEALKAFGPSYPDSPLKPTSVLLLAYCYNQAGRQDDARLTLEGFLKDYPEHELAVEARAGIDLLKGGK